MNEYHKESTVSDLPQDESINVAAVLKDIQQRLVFLERKIDTLLNQSLEKPAFQGRNFSRPARPFGRFKKHSKGPYNPSFGKENFSQSQPGHFDKPREGENQGFDGKKKRFFHRGHGKFNKKSSYK